MPTGMSANGRDKAGRKEKDGVCRLFCCSFVPIVRTALCNLHAVIHNPKNQTILLINTNTPKAGEFALERFRLFLTLVSVAVNILNEAVDLFQRLLILRLSIKIGIPGSIQPQLFHQSNSIIITAYLFLFFCNISFFCF